MKYLFTLGVLLLNTFLLCSQEDKKQMINNGEWLVTNYFGIATLDNDDSFKGNATVYGGLIGKEIILSSHFSFITGVEFLTLQTDYSNTEGQQLYLKNNYVKIPAGIKYTYNTSQKNTVFIIGQVYASNLYRSKIENLSINSDNIKNGLGSNFGFQANIGLEHQLDSILSFNIGLNSQSDLIKISKDLKYKIKDLYAFQIGIGVNL